MAGKPAAASQVGAAEQREREAPGEGAQPGERVGPLAIEWLRKEDGRALILYSSAQRPAA